MAGLASIWHDRRGNPVPPQTLRSRLSPLGGQQKTLQMRKCKILLFTRWDYIKILKASLHWSKLPLYYATVFLIIFLSMREFESHCGQEFFPFFKFLLFHIPFSSTCPIQMKSSMILIRDNKCMERDMILKSRFSKTAVYITAHYLQSYMWMSSSNIRWKKYTLNKYLYIIFYKINTFSFKLQSNSVYYLWLIYKNNALV